MDKLKSIQIAYENFEEKAKKEKGARFWDTEVGIYGPTYTDLIFRFFCQLPIGAQAKFMDLGAGDGRVVLVASLFCKAFGIEYNKELVVESKRIAQEVGVTCELMQGDFLTLDISPYDFLFINPDQGFHKGLEEKLLKEMKPHQQLWVHNKIFLPERLKRGRTIWIDQIPITEYRNGL